MKKIITLLSLVILAVIYSQGGFNDLFKPSTAFAVGDLTINWGVPAGNPIFTIANMHPGQIESRLVHINNASSGPRPIAIKEILASDSGHLGDALDIVISRNGSDIYGGSLGEKTLTQFLSDSNNPSGISLFTLNSGAGTDIIFKVIFKSQSQNEYQGKIITFDIQIGIAFDLPPDCQSIIFTGPVIYGTSGEDNLKGGSGNQIILGLEGNDEIHGGKGRDCIIGGTGKDRIYAGDNGDIIYGDEGDDKIDGGKGPDIIHGGTGKDHIVGGDGNDQIFGDEGDDSLHADKGTDIVHGGPGNDLEEGGEGNDQVFGDEGNDDLEGNAGNDQLNGGPGIDKVDGGDGNDTCTASENTRSCTLIP